MWVLLDDREHTINPSWAQIEDALRRMDNRNHHSVRLWFDADADPANVDRDDMRPFMAADGGGRMLVSFCEDEDLVGAMLIDPTQTVSVELIVGGQAAEYHAAHEVPLELALQAFRHYFETRQLDRSLIWENPYAD